MWLYVFMKANIQKYIILILGGPDFQEGLHSQIGEDEFYDAVENALDKLEEGQQSRDGLKQMSNLRQNSQLDSDSLTHPLWPQIDEVCHGQLQHGLWRIIYQQLIYIYVFCFLDNT